MAYVIEQAWKTVFERDRRQEMLDKVGTMDSESWDLLLSMAGDAMWAERKYRETCSGMYFGTMVKRECFECYADRERLSDMLWSACRIVHVDMRAVYSAARILDRYYERGGSKIVDAEMLIRSQM